MPNEADDLGAALAAPAGSIAAAMAEAFPPLAVTDAMAKITADIRAEWSGLTDALEALTSIGDALTGAEHLAPLADLVDAHRDGLATIAAAVGAARDALTDATAADHTSGSSTSADALSCARTRLAALDHGMADDIAEAHGLARLARVALATPGAEAIPTEAAEHDPSGPWSIGHYPVAIICREAPRLARQRRARTRRTVSQARQLRRSIARRHDTPRPVPASPVAARPRHYCRRTYAGARRSDDPSPTRSAESPTGGFMSGRSASLTQGEGAPTARRA